MEKLTKRKNYLISMQEHYSNNTIDLSFYIRLIENNFDYIYIFHDKEQDLHFHAILINCRFTFHQLLEMFPSADIEVQKSSNLRNYNYLLHKDERSIIEGKTPYSPSLIHSNIDLVEFCKGSHTFDYSLLLDEVIKRINSGEYNSMSELTSSNKSRKKK